MKTITRVLAPVMLAASAALAVPAAAQVQGPMASLDVTRTVLGSNSLAKAYTDINQSYAQQNELVRTKGTERQTILRAFDKDGNGQVDDAELEAAQKDPQFAKLQTLEQEITQITNQVNAARIYAIEQILEQISPSLQQVVADKKIQLVIDPGSVLYAPASADITQDVVNALNTRLPSVSITPQEGWQPSRPGVQMFQEVQQLLVAVQRQQQQQQQQTGGAEAPVGR